RGIHISNNHHASRFVFDTGVFERDHDASRLLCVTARSDTQMNVWHLHSKVAKKVVGHLRVIMLASMNQERLHWQAASPAIQCFQDCRNLNEVWTRACNKKNSHIRPPVAARE